MTTEQLPALNAVLNGLCTICLLIGRSHIRAGRRGAHKKFMIAAATFSVMFLVSYLVYHALHGSTPFKGEGPIRYLYFTILITHTVLAAANVPLVGVTLVRGLRSSFAAHKKLARWTYPVWLYVSVTGIVIYLMLYHMYPGPATAGNP